MSGGAQLAFSRQVKCTHRRLRSLALVNSCAFVFASWCVAFALSSAFSGQFEPEFVVLSLFALCLSMPAATDMLIRYGHYQVGGKFWPNWLMRFVLSQRFRPLPSNMIVDGDAAAGEWVEAWLCGLGAEFSDVHSWAKAIRAHQSHLTSADALNLWLYAQVIEYQDCHFELEA